MSFKLTPPPSTRRRPKRVAYALPTLFTAGNIFLGFIAILKTFEGAISASAGALGPNASFEAAAKMIGVAVLLDGLDGRIARMTNTVRDFGREMDSLADVIPLGVALAVLALPRGFLFLDSTGLDPVSMDHLRRAGVFVCFVFLLCCAARLARFNVQNNPIPQNPGRPDRKYFVGLPTPAAAGMLASV